MWDAVMTVNEDKMQQIQVLITVGHEPTFSAYEHMWKSSDHCGS